MLSITETDPLCNLEKGDYRRKMIDYEYYYEQYRRVPRNSVNTQRDLLDYHSTVFPSTCTVWPASIKRSVTTAYIDGRKLLDLHESPYGMNGSFPKGKSRRKPFTPCEKKIVNKYLKLIHYIKCIIFCRIQVMFLYH